MQLPEKNDQEVNVLMNCLNIKIALFTPFLHAPQSNQRPACAGRVAHRAEKQVRPERAIEGV